jgi:hypothetical protein
MKNYILSALVGDYMAMRQEGDATLQQAQSCPQTPSTSGKKKNKK